MKRYLFLITIFFPSFLYTQSFFQNPVLDYLGSSVDEMGIINKYEFSYRNSAIFLYGGLGKRILLYETPTALINVSQVTFFPRANQPLLFGGINKFGPYNYPSLKISGSSTGEAEVNLKLYNRFKDNINHSINVNGYSFNHRMDENKDNFIDMPVKRRLLIRDNLYFLKNNRFHQVIVDYLKVKEQGGAMNFDEKIHRLGSDVYGFGEDIDHLAINSFNHWRFNDNKEKIMADFSGRIHRQDSYFGMKDYIGNENLWEGRLGYFKKMMLSNIQIGLQYKYHDIKERLAENNLNRREHSVGLFGIYKIILGNKWQVNTFVNLDYHNLLKWELHPSFKVNYKSFENIQFSFFGGSGYQYANVLANNKSLLISNRSIFIEEIAATKATYFGGMMNVKLSELINFGRNTTWTMQYFQRFYNNQPVVDIDQDADELHVYNLVGKARRRVLESSIRGHRHAQYNWSLSYRLDLAKTTIDGKYRTLPFHSTHNIFATASYDILPRKLDFNVQLQYVFGSPQRIPSQAKKSPALHQFDARLEVPLNVLAENKIWKRFSFFTGVENIFNQKQTDIYQGTESPFENGFDGSLRWGQAIGTRVFGGVKYNFN